MTQDVPSPIDLRDPADARAWADAAQQRPGRIEIFDAISTELRSLPDGSSVLELGSGPGFLAEHLLNTLPGIRISLLDFSTAMHDLARERLATHEDRVSFIERDFKRANWSDGLDQFETVITNQAVHELRHKDHASTLHAQVRPLLKDTASYLVSDHFFGEGGLGHDQLYMTVDEQRIALMNAGFTEVTQLLQTGSLSLYRAR